MKKSQKNVGAIFKKINARTFECVGVLTVDVKLNLEAAFLILKMGPHIEVGPKPQETMTNTLSANDEAY